MTLPHTGPADADAPAAGRRVGMVWAQTLDGTIGNQGTMPWHLPEDFAFFKRTTMGHAMVMGRKTFDSIGRALPGRRTIVITRQTDWRHPDVETVHSLDDALGLAGPVGEVFVAGGGEVYAQAMPFAHRLLITEVDQEPEGDARFPEIDPTVWRETAREDHDGFSWVTYER